jgi:hypothetical protein
MSLVKCDVVCAGSSERLEPVAFASFSRVPCMGEHVLLPSKGADGAGALVSFRVVQVTHHVDRTESDVAARIQVTAEAVAGTV